MPGNDILGDLKVFITGENAKLVKALKDSENKTEASAKNIDSTLKKLSKSFQNVGKKLTTFVTLPIIGAGVAAVKFASDTSESLNAVNVVFGESAGIIQDWSDQAVDMAGLTTAEFNQFGAQLGAIVKESGVSLNQAAEDTSSLIFRAADLASIFNTDVTQALQALQSGLAGQSEPLRRFSIFLDEAAVNARAVELGLADSTTEVDQAGKLQARYSLIMEKSNSFAGDFVNTSDELANSTRILTAEIKEVAADLGKELLPIVKDMVTFARDLVQQFSELDEEQKKTILTIVGVAAAIGPLLIVGGKLLGFLNTLKAGFAALGAVGGPIALVATAITGVIVAFSLLDQAISTSQYEALGKEFGSLREELELTNAEFRTVVQELERVSSNRSADNMREIFSEIAERTGRTSAELLQVIDSSQRLQGIWNDALVPIREQVSYMEGMQEYAQSIHDIADDRVAREKEIADEIQRQSDEAQAFADAIKSAFDAETRVIQDFATAWQGLVALQGAGFRDEQQFLESAISLRDEEISRLENRALIEGQLSERDRARLELLRAANTESQKQLEILEENTEEYIQAEQEKLAAEQEALDIMRSARLQAIAEVKEAGKEAHEERLEQLREEANLAIDTGQEVAGSILQIGSNLGDAELQRIQKTNDAEIKRLKQSGASAEQIAAVKERLEEELDKKKRKFAHDEAVRSKVLGLINVVINTAQAVVKSLPNYFLAAAVGITGAIQAGVIASQAIPALASGGIVDPNSPIRAIIGDNTKYKEVVAPLSPGVFSEIATGIVNELSSRSGAASSQGSSTTTITEDSGFISDEPRAIRATMVFNMDKVQVTRQVVEVLENGIVEINLN